MTFLANMLTGTLCKLAKTAAEVAVSAIKINNPNASGVIDSGVKFFESFVPNMPNGCTKSIFGVVLEVLNNAK